MIILIALLIRKLIVVILHQIHFAQFKTLKTIAKQVIILIVLVLVQESIILMMALMLVLCFLLNFKSKELNVSPQMVFFAIRAMDLTAIQWMEVIALVLIKLILYLQFSAQ